MLLFKSNENQSGGEATLYDVHRRLGRKIGSVNMIGREREIKFYSGDFVVNKSYYNTLLHRQEVLAKEVSRKK